MSDKIVSVNEEYKNYLKKFKLCFNNFPEIELSNVITFGTFDLFHISHSNILKRANSLG